MKLGLQQMNLEGKGINSVHSGPTVLKKLQNSSLRFLTPCSVNLIPPLQEWGGEENQAELRVES